MTLIITIKINNKKPQENKQTKKRFHKKWAVKWTKLRSLIEGKK